MDAAEKCYKEVAGNENDLNDLLGLLGKLPDLFNA